MGALRILVAVMGIVIIVGFGVVIAVIAGRLSRGGGATPAHSFGAADIDIPRGSRIEAMTTAPDRVILELVLPDGGRQLVVIDLNTGIRLGTIGLNPAP